MSPEYEALREKVAATIWESGPKLAADDVLRIVAETMREPSKAMVDAAIGRDNTYDGATMYRGVWRAMLAAHPISEAMRDE
jgi:hypothetical protein